MQVGGGDAAGGGAHVHHAWAHALGRPIFLPTQLHGEDRVDVGLLKRFRHAIEHAAREVGGDHFVAGQPERHGKRPGAASHVEYGFPRLDTRQLDEAASVSAGFGAGREGVRAKVPVGGVVGLAARLLQSHPFRVPIGGGEHRGEGLHVDGGLGADFDGWRAFAE